MASIFKRGGSKNRAAGYYVSWYERPGVRKTKYAGKDKSAAEALGRKLDTDAMLRREGVFDERDDRWAAADARPVVEHVDEFVAALRAAGRTEIHVTHVKKHMDCIVEAISAKRLSHLTPSAVQRAIGDLVKHDKLALRTANAYLTSLKAFSRWAWQDGRARDYTLGPLRSYNAETDRKRVRRALTDPEIYALIHTAFEGPVVLDMAGPDRAMLYAVAIGTGFRLNELRSLTPASFALDATPPTVTVEAGYSKRRRRDVQPLPPSLAKGLKPWLAEKPAGRPVFGTLPRAAEMLKVDLGTAEIKEMPEGVVDFHALRHTYISRLVRSGVNIKLAQELARHSSPILTLGRYAHVDMSDKANAVARVPELAAPAGERITTCQDSSTALRTAHVRPATLQTGTTGHQSPDDARDEELDNDAAEVVDSKALGDARPDAARVVASKFGSAAGVAEWQTRGIQNPVRATS